MLIGYYRETNHHGVEKRRISDRGFARLEVVADIELELIRTSMHRLIVEQRLLSTPVDICGGARTQLSHVSKCKQANLYTRRRTAVSRIEDMCCESSHSAPISATRRAEQGTDYTLLKLLRAYSACDSLLSVRKTR